MGTTELGEGARVNIHFNGDVIPVVAFATEDQIREALMKDNPDVANARITKDEATGDWTVTREAGQKGA